jgi:hypothetical protein
MGNDEGISPSPDDPKDPKCLNRMCGPKEEKVSILKIGRSILLDMIIIDGRVI